MPIDRNPLHRPVGIFDAGIGSYAVVRLVQQRYPQQDIIYLADRASFPYGAKDKSALHDVTAAAITRLRDRGAEAIIVASNAPTITVLEEIKRTARRPVLGVYPPLTRAIEVSESKSIGLLGVKSLVESKELSQYIDAQRDGSAKVTPFNASPLVELVESGLFLKKPMLTREVIRHFLSSILIAYGDIDVFTLSSTHLPWLKGMLEALFPELIFLDPAEEVVAALAPYVTQGTGKVSCVVTANDAYPFEAFEAMLKKLGIPLLAERI